MIDTATLAQVTDPQKRYDYLILFDVTDGNPNGDPDAGNLPRVDPETLEGIVTDVCLKRKIRNYIDLLGQSTPTDADEVDKEGRPIADNGIFVRDSGIALNRKIETAVKKADSEAKQDKKKENRKGKEEICRRYYDVRMFGAVLSTGDYNCGQVRGPMQLTFARSRDAIVPSEIAITRLAITKEGENKETEMGRKASVPYGLYLGKGFFSPMLGDASKGGTGVTKKDLELYWQALANMFEMDRSAARGYMEMKGIYVFVHDNPLGNQPSGKLFGEFKCRRKDESKPPRKFEDYDLKIEDPNLDGVTLVKLLG